MAEAVATERGVGEAAELLARAALRTGAGIGAADRPATARAADVQRIAGEVQCHERDDGRAAEAEPSERGDAVHDVAVGVRSVVEPVFGPEGCGDRDVD